MNEQMTLSFPPVHNFTRENFIIANCNFEASKWVKEWAELKQFALIIYGAAGCGKTHLAQIWGQEQAGARLDSIPKTDDLQQNQLLGRNLILEDIEEKLGLAIQRSVTEKLLFHFLNRHKEEHGTLLITARTVSSYWEIILPDLASRLQSIPAVKIHSPGIVFLANLIEKLLTDRGVKVQGGIGHYLSIRIPRDYSYAHELVKRLDKAALKQSHYVTIDLAKKVLRTMNR